MVSLGTESDNKSDVPAFIRSSNQPKTSSAPLRMPNGLCRTRGQAWSRSRGTQRGQTHQIKLQMGNTAVKLPVMLLLLLLVALSSCSHGLCQNLQEKAKKKAKSTWHFVGTVTAHIRATSAYRAQSATKIKQPTLLMVWGMEEIILVLV